MVLETIEDTKIFFEPKENFILDLQNQYFKLKYLSFRFMVFMGLLILISGLMAFISNRKHVLNILLSLEYIILSLIWLMIVCLMRANNYFIILYFFVFVVCEGALGLGLIVVLIRGYGRDLVINLSLVQC